MDRKNSDMIEEITTLPDNYVIAEIKDFYKIDYKTKRWIFKVGMEFIVQSFYSDLYEKYIITEEWNDVKYTYINSISNIENNIIINNKFSIIVLPVDFFSMINVKFGYFNNKPATHSENIIVFNSFSKQYLIIVLLALCK